MNPTHPWILPDWPAPANVHACTTTRQGGVSAAPYDSLNLGDHVGDAALMVARNRRIVGETLRLPAEPLWLEQVHGVTVADMGAAACHPRADAAISRHLRQVCVVMTADCLPVLFCDRDGTRVAAAHAGWRGLCGGVLERTVQALQCDPARLLVWLGPAIGPAAFEVGEEVRTAFMAHDRAAAAAFVPGAGPGKWWCDIYRLARQRLAAAGIVHSHVSGGDCCTVQDVGRFFSYRRDGTTGRMASLVWFS